MAQVYGQIESLKKIRLTLDQKGINRFNSTSAIQDFLANYKFEKANIYQRHENELEDDIGKLKERDKQNQQDLEKQRNEAAATLDAKISLNNSRIDKLDELHEIVWVLIVLIPIAVIFMQQRIKYLQKNYDRIISKSTNDTEAIIKRDLALLNEYTLNREQVIKLRSFQEIKKLAYTKEAILELNPLIAGAVGENLVVKEIEKLSDEYILINDFSQSFNPPIYNRKEKDKIFSIQIDHLLISRAGVFVLETKNWSKESIRSLDLRSPIDQIKRTSYALFVILNNSNKNGRIRLNSHHWGSKQIPIRNVIVMIKNKPKEDFKFVKVKTLNELNRYVTYFDPIFSQAEVESIAQYFVRLSE